MTPPEQRCSQIEEAIATTWSLEWFTDYLYGMAFHVEMDHKPQRFECVWSDTSTLSLIHLERGCRRPVARSSGTTSDRGRRAIDGRRDGTANLVVGALPATEKRLAEIRARQLEYDVCGQVMRYCAECWPSHPSLPSVFRAYWQVQNDLTILNGLHLKGARLVSPTCVRLAMLDKLHEDHKGFVKSRSRAQSSVLWPGLSRQREELVRSCTTCALERRNPSQPMIASETNLRPWQKVGTVVQ